MSRPLYTVAICVALLLIAGETARCTHSRRTNGRAHRTSLTAAGRSMGGWDRRQHREPFSFIVPLYRGFDLEKNSEKGDGFLAGYGLLLRNLTMLVHDHVLARASIGSGKRRVLLGWGQNDQGPGWMGPRLSARDYFWHAWSPTYYVRPLAKLAAGVSLVRLEPESERQFAARLPPDLILPKPSPPVKFLHTTSFARPALNWNTSLHENCYVYSYSLPYASKDRNDARVFSRWPVKLMRCLDGHVCTFINDIRRHAAAHTSADKQTGGTGPLKPQDKTKDGLVCNTWHDVGAPVMCSSLREETGAGSSSSWYERNHLKLSYMVLGLVANASKSDVECSIAFKALKLADFYDKLK